MWTIHTETKENTETFEQQILRFIIHWDSCETWMQGDLCLHHTFSLWNKFMYDSEVWSNSQRRPWEDSHYLNELWRGLWCSSTLFSTHTQLAQVQGDNAFDKFNQKLRRGLIAFFRTVLSLPIYKTCWPRKTERVGWSLSKKY